MVCLGSFDGKLRLMSMYSWNLAFVFPLGHPREMEAGIDTTNMTTTVEVSTALAHEAADGEAHREGGVATSTIFSTLDKQQPQAVKDAPSEIGANKAAANKGSGRVSSSAAAHRETVEKNRSQGLLTADKAAAAGNNSTCYVARMLKSLPKAAGAATEGLSSAAAASSGKGLKENSLPNLGVSWCGWSQGDGGHYLAARDDSHPRCLWVWHPLTTRLVALIVQLKPISCARWRPYTKTITPPPLDPDASTDSADPPAEQASCAQTQPVLVFVTGSSRLYFWSPVHGSSWADLPALGQGAASSSNGGLHQLCLTSVHWSADGHRILCRGREAYCVCEVDYSDLQMQSHTQPPHRHHAPHDQHQ